MTVWDAEQREHMLLLHNGMHYHSLHAITLYYHPQEVFRV